MIALTGVFTALAVLGIVITGNIAGPIGLLFAIAAGWYQRARDVR